MVSIAGHERDRETQHAPARLRIREDENVLRPGEWPFVFEVRSRPRASYPIWGPFRDRPQGFQPGCCLILQLGELAERLSFLVVPAPGDWIGVVTPVRRAGNRQAEGFAPRDLLRLHGGREGDDLTARGSAGWAFGLPVARLPGRTGCVFAEEGAVYPRQKVSTASARQTFLIVNRMTALSSRTGTEHEYQSQAMARTGRPPRRPTRQRGRSVIP